MCKMENSDATDSEKDENGEGPQPSKMRRTLSSMINSMKMTEEEIRYRNENFDHVNVIEEYQTYLKCTKCDMEFQDKINHGEEVGIHPLLLVLMCASCRDYYGDGNFSLDSEGEDKYCRWCGEGGTIFSCSKCICGFCDICIKKHFGEDEQKRVESDDDWICYFCNPKPLWDLRSICSLAWQASKNKKEQLGKITVKLRKRKKYRKSFEKDNDKSLSSDSSYSIVNEKQSSKRQLKYAMSRNNSENDPSSSSEDDKENSIKRKRRSRTKKKSLEKDTTESDFAVKKKPKISSDPTFENKKTVVLNKLKSIWKLTQTIASVGLSLSRKRLKQLEQSDSFRNLEDLQAEHYDLKSFTTTLVSSLKSAASSIDSIKEDLSVDVAHDDKELDKYPLWLEVIRRFIRSSEFETPFGLKLLAFTLNEIVQNNEISSLSLNLSKTLLKREATELSHQNIKEQQAQGSGDSDKEDQHANAFNESASYSEDDENIRTDEYSKKLSENLPNNFHKFSNNIPSSSLTEKKSPEDLELDRLLRLASIKSIKLRSTKRNYTDQKETLENREVKCKPKEKEVSQAETHSGEPKLSLLDCFSSQGNEESGESVTRQIKEDDFVKQFNIEVKNLFLYSSESCPSDVSQSEKEEIQADENFKKNTILKKALQNRKRRKNDLQKYRISTDEDESETQRPVKPLKRKEEKEKLTPKEGKKIPVEEKTKSEEEKGMREEKECDIISDSESSVEVVIQPSDSDSEIVQIDEVPQEPCRVKGRKNINKILDVKNLQQETKIALKMEMERKRRLKDRQELINKTFENTNENSKLVLDFDPDTMQELVVVDENLSKHLKPHQREGVKFMWNCCFESLRRIKEEKGSGCVLAHCMGLGKTLQVIALIHSALTHSPHLRTVLIVCPPITLGNWFHEFKAWMKGCSKPIEPFDLGTARNRKLGQLLLWMERGGVLIISYEMFRTLVKKDSYSRHKICLLDPGPDIVICDEGHLMKNPNSGLSKCVSKIRTLRRIVLTGTPLQNNLIEYYCMVQFVKPNLLGTKKEFMNRFVNPITNGQFENSTQKDVFIMKQRSHVLHTLLQSFVQRLGYDVLEPLLPRKQEFVILIALTDTQEKMYNLCIKKPLKESRGLLWDFHWYHKVWTHPLVVRRYFEHNKIEDGLREPWEKLIPEYEYDSIGSSNKLRLFFSILRKCRQVGDKLLVFSQSLYTLGLIEFFLLKLNKDSEKGNHSEFADVWTLGRDYFKLTGSTKPEDREIYFERFSSTRRACLFLISTKAGGLGINLVAANRVVLFDASWNPAHDLQSIFRVYRFGQKKPCYVYRFLAAATMEEKIYNRQITKLSLAHRILDEHQIERHYSSHNLLELYTYNPLPKSEWKVPKIPKDQILAEIMSNNRDIIVGYHEHNSLLENKEEEELTEEERRAAWENYEKEKASPKKDFGDRNFWATLQRPSDELISKYKKNSANILEVASCVGHEYQNQFTSVSLNRASNAYLNPQSLLQLASSFGLKPYKGEKMQMYLKRVERVVRNIFPWCAPQVMIQSNVMNEE